MIQVLGKSKEIDGMTTEAIGYLRSIYHQFQRHRRLFVLFLFRSRKPRHEGTICSPDVISPSPPLFFSVMVLINLKNMCLPSPQYTSRTFSFAVSAEYGDARNETFPIYRTLPENNFSHRDDDV